jgi:hypothetical protein
VIDGNSMVILTISVVFRHVCVLFGAMKEAAYQSLSSSIPDSFAIYQDSHGCSCLSDTILLVSPAVTDAPSPARKRFATNTLQ